MVSRFRPFTRLFSIHAAATLAVLLLFISPRIAIGASTSIAVETSPSGRIIIVDGTSYTSPQSFAWDPGSMHTIETISPQGTGSTRYVFTSWSDGGAISHPVTAPSEPATYRATFNTQFRLTTSVNPSSGGTIDVTPPSADGFYDAGTALELQATPNAGYEFQSWSGDVSGSGNPQTFTLGAPRIAVANFDRVAGLGAGSAVFALRPNAPNPFAEATAFSFSLPVTSRATLRIFDARGALVTTLIDGELGAGTHRIVWNGRAASGRRVADGVYYYRLENGTRLATRGLCVIH
jgi:hypothetical protein